MDAVAEIQALAAYLRRQKIKDNDATVSQLEDPETLDRGLMLEDHKAPIKKDDVETYFNSVTEDNIHDFKTAEQRMVCRKECSKLYKLLVAENIDYDRDGATYSNLVTLQHSYNRSTRKGLVIIEAARLTRIGNSNDTGVQEYYSCARVRYRFIYRTDVPCRLDTEVIELEPEIIQRSRDETGSLRGMMEKIVDMVGHIERTGVWKPEDIGINPEDAEQGKKTVTFMITDIGPKYAVQRAIITAGRIIREAYIQNEPANALTFQNQDTLQKTQICRNQGLGFLYTLIAALLLYLFKTSTDLQDARPSSDSPFLVAAIFSGCHSPAALSHLYRPHVHHLASLR
eukprot:GEMP01054738.1.p1 GENE.GEMP01054738.1~~GEMP01054738.1.p1  ORF type:complete len:342 (+),score=9.89 GEMP01054738.1:36-1061(+)